MENPCKPNIEEKHYNYPRFAETNVNNDSSKTQIRNVDCPKRGFFGIGGTDEPPPLLVSELLKKYL